MANMRERKDLFKPELRLNDIDAVREHQERLDYNELLGDLGMFELRVFTLQTREDHVEEWLERDRDYQIS